MSRLGLFDFEFANPIDGEWKKGAFDPDFGDTGATAAITGTASPTITEADVVAGGKTVIITLTGDTWVASGAAFNAIRQDIINGLTAAASPANGWNLVVKATQGVAGVVRTSATVVTVTLDAFATYDIASTETITVTVPASAVVLAQAIVATPTFTVTAVASGVLFRRTSLTARTGSRMAA